MGFLDFLGNFFGSGGPAATLQAVFSYLVNAMQTLFTYLWNTLVAVFNYLTSLFGKVANFFHYIWDNFFKRIFNGLFNAIMKAHDWLESKLGPLLRFLTKMRAFIDNVMNKYVKPIMNIIQKLRQFLQVLKLFHVKWAQALDDKLLKIEVKMAAVFIEARQILNGVIDAVNLVIDPAKLLRHPVLIISIRRSLPAIVRSVTGFPLSYWTGANAFIVDAPDGSGPTWADMTDPAINPPASQLLGDSQDIPSFDFMSTAVDPQDSDVDQLEPLGLFAEPAVPEGGCSTIGADFVSIKAAIEAYMLRAAQDAIDSAKLTLNTLGVSGV